MSLSSLVRVHYVLGRLILADSYESRLYVWCLLARRLHTHIQEIQLGWNTTSRCVACIASRTALRFSAISFLRVSAILCNNRAVGRHRRRSMGCTHAQAVENSGSSTPLIEKKKSYNIFQEGPNRNKWITNLRKGHLQHWNEEVEICIVMLLLRFYLFLKAIVPMVTIQKSIYLYYP